MLRLEAAALDGFVRIGGRNVEGRSWSPAFFSVRTRWRTAFDRLGRVLVTVSDGKRVLPGS